MCVDLIGSSPLTQTKMADFIPRQPMIDVAHRRRGKYMAKCATIGYVFIPFSFSYLGELEVDADTLLKQVQKFSMTQDIGARIAIHIFNRISFAISKGVETVGLQSKLLRHTGIVSPGLIFDDALSVFNTSMDWPFE
nr:hypothetical protein [Tanacetum cinerariifolium]